jgi:hypothetical protein
MANDVPNRAILSAEERAMLATAIEQSQLLSFTDVARATGLHPEILRMLVRNNVIEGHAPQYLRLHGIILDAQDRYTQILRSLGYLWQ